MNTNKNITHVGGKGEAAAQDAFAAMLAKAYAEKSGTPAPAPAPVDNSAWKPAQAEPQARRFPIKPVLFCVALMALVFYFGVLA